MRANAIKKPGLTVFETFGFLDSTVILVYFAVTLGIGLYFARRKESSAVDYFLAGRNIGWVAVGFSLFATNISSEHFLGLAGSGANRGLAVGSFEWMAIFILVVMGWVVAPVFIRLGVFTVPEYLEIRYDRRSRVYLTSISLFAYIVTKISVMLFAAGFLLNHMLGWDVYTTAIILVFLAGIYTVAGGLTAVIYTQIFQTVVLIAGALLVTFIGLNEVGGFSGLQEKLPPDYFTLFKPMSDPDFPWTGIIFGAPIVGFWYWCTDQYIVQRVLASKSIDDARKGTLLAAAFKILPVLMLVVPGLIAVALFPDVSGDEAYPALLESDLLPAGVRGLVVAAIIAALMSSLASVFNSAATLFTVDFYQPRHPETSERKLVLVGRLATLFITITAILWVPLTKLISTNIYIYMQSIQSYISPPIVAVFLFGIFSKKMNASGAFWCLITGGVLGLSRLVIEFMVNSGTLTAPWAVSFASLNYLHFAILLFLLCTGVLIAVSRLTDSQTTQQASGLMIAGKQIPDSSYAPLPAKKTGRWAKQNVFTSVIICVLVISLMGLLA